MTVKAARVVVALAEAVLALGVGRARAVRIGAVRGVEARAVPRRRVRAERARRIALMLPEHDAELARSYARECEIKALQLIDGQLAPLAA